MIKKHIPKIRFQGFDEEWERRKLGDITEIKTGSSDLKDSILDGAYPFFVRSENIERSNRYLFEGEAILIPGDGRLGEIFHYINGRFDFHQRVYKISNFSDNNISGKYILYEMQKNFKLHAMKHTVKATVDSLRLPTLLNYNISLPSLPEQESIGQLFRTLDDLISAYKKNLEHYQNLKTSMLSKMFPKEGQKQPEIRLDGFDGDWEVVVLGNYSKIITGGTPKTTNVEYWTPKEIPWMSSGEINKKRIKSTDTMISKFGFDNSSAKWVRSNSILIALAGQGKTRGMVAINEIELTTNQSLAAIEMNDNLNYQFLFAYLEKSYNILRNVSSGDGTRGGLNKKIISDLKIPLPSLPEQEAIGAFFANLDETISSYKDKVGQLELLKKNLLSQMFI